MDEHQKGSKTKEDTAVELAKVDFENFEAVINPELHADFILATNKLPPQDVSYIVRVVILAIAFGRRMEAKDQVERDKNKPKIALPGHFKH